MENINLTGKKVTHPAFGTGTILKQDGDYVTVQFPIGEKMFVYPDAFSHFLTAAGAKLQQQLQAAAEKKIISLQQAEAARKAERDKVWEKKDVKQAAAEEPARAAEKNYRRSNAAFKCKHADEKVAEDWEKVAEQLAGLKQIKRNSVCVLTARDAKAPENQRYIFAVGLAEADTDKTTAEPRVHISEKYRLHLSDAEAHGLLFWNYHASKNSSGEPAWSSGVHRYISDAEAVQILRDIVTIKTGAREEHLALDFFNHFCQATQIDMSKVGNPAGALIK